MKLKVVSITTNRRTIVTMNRSSRTMCTPVLRRMTHWAFGAIAVLFLVPGCLVSDIEDLCQEIAETQCDQCLACGNETVPASATCDLTVATGREQCIQVKKTHCSNQASTVEMPKEELNACIDSQVRSTCIKQREQAVRGVSPTTPECVYFL